MKVGDIVKYKSHLYQIVSIDWDSLANRFKFKPIACSSPEHLSIFKEDIYVNNSEKIELFSGSTPKYQIGQRVKYNSHYYLVRFTLIKNGTYDYQIKAEEEWRGYEWVYENQLGL